MTEEAIPLESDYLRVSNLHEIYYETFGNPKGLPVVLLHGGPGGHCKPSLTEFFDLNKWYVIMFDQRGSMRSRPSPCLEENTTQLHIEDIETLREHLSIDKWVVFGGSWGSLLGILYGEAHPESCLGFILRGMFLGLQKDITHAFYGIGEYYPEDYERFLDIFNEEEKSDLIKACYNRIHSSTPEEMKQFIRSWVMYIANSYIPLSSTKTSEDFLEEETLFLSVGSNFIHYCYHNFFIEENQAIDNLHRISHLPATLVHGRFDRICMPDRSHSVHKAWKGSTLHMVERGTHFAEDPEVSPVLKKATEKMYKKVKNAAVTK